MIFLGNIHSNTTIEELNIYNNDYIEIKKLFELSNYSEIIQMVESISEKVLLFPVKIQLIFKLYYCQSLIQSGNILKAFNISKEVQNSYSLAKLTPIEKIIYYSIMIVSLTRIGNIEEAVGIQLESFEIIKQHKQLLVSSPDRYWYYYYLIVSSTLEIKKKNYTIAFDTLKQTGNYFIRSITKDSSNWFVLSWIYILLGQIHKQTNYLGLATNDFKKAIDCGLKATNLEYIRTAYLYLALTYEEQGREYLVKLTIEELIQETENSFDSDEYSISSAYNLLGNINNRLGEFQLAKDYYLKAYSMITDPKLKQRIKSYYLNNMGVLSYKMANYTESLIYFKESLDLASVIGDPNELAYYYSNIGESLLVLERYDQAIGYEIKALESINKIKNDDLLVETYFILERIYLEKEDFQQADYYINEIQIKALESNKIIYDLKYKLALGMKYKKQQNIEKANEKLLSVLDYPHTLYDLQTIALTEIAEMIIRLDLDAQRKYAKELEKVTQKLEALVRGKNSIPLTCTFAIYSAKRKIQSFEFHSAETILLEAIDMCLEKNVEYFREKLTQELTLCQEIKQIYSEQQHGRTELLTEKVNSFELISNLRNLQRFMLADIK